MYVWNSIFSCFDKWSSSPIATPEPYLKKQMFRWMDLQKFVIYDLKWARPSLEKKFYTNKNH